MVRIHFDKAHEANGFYTLMTSGIPVRALDNGVYIVNVTQLRILEDNYIPYERLD